VRTRRLARQASPQKISVEQYPASADLVHRHGRSERLRGAQPDTVGIPTLTSLNLPADDQIWRRQAFWLKDLVSLTLEHCEYVIVGRQPS
jgi:hypothetical protein